MRSPGRRRGPPPRGPRSRSRRTGAPPVGGGSPRPRLRAPTPAGRPRGTRGLPPRPLTRPRRRSGPRAPRSPAASRHRRARGSPRGRSSGARAAVRRQDRSRGGRRGTGRVRSRTQGGPVVPAAWQDRLHEQAGPVRELRGEEPSDEGRVDHGSRPPAEGSRSRTRVGPASPSGTNSARSTRSPASSIQ